MNISADTMNGPLLSAGYSQTAGVYDEMCAAPGVLRPHWDVFINSLSALGRARTGAAAGKRQGSEFGKTASPTTSMAIRWEWIGPWNLDAIPLMIPPSEWSQLEAGLIQRARLLNLILADLYGPQQLLRGGQIPPALVFANPGFWRPCHGVTVSGQHVSALARGGPGARAGWRMVGDFRPHAGAFRRGLFAGKSHRHGGNLSRTCSASSRSSGWLRSSVPFAKRCCVSRP